MKKTKMFTILLLICFGCKTDSVENTKNQVRSGEDEMVFDQEKWKAKENGNYLYRDKMVKDVVYNDTIRTLGKDQILKVLGEPDYVRDDHLYYRIDETRLGNWSLKTKTMVIKLAKDSVIVWIKIHE